MTVLELAIEVYLCNKESYTLHTVLIPSSCGMLVYRLGME